MRIERTIAGSLAALAVSAAVVVAIHMTTYVPDAPAVWTPDEAPQDPQIIAGNGNSPRELVSDKPFIPRRRLEVEPHRVPNPLPFPLKWGEETDGLQMGVEFLGCEMGYVGWAFTFKAQVRNLGKDTCMNGGGSGGIRVEYSFKNEKHEDIRIRRSLGHANSMCAIAPGDVRSAVVTVWFTREALDSVASIMKVRPYLARDRDRVLLSGPEVPLDLDWREIPESQMNEKCALLHLDNLARSNAEFRRAKVIDADNDGKGEFGFVNEMTGAGRSRCGPAHRNTHSPYLFGCNVKTDSRGRLELNGYFFIVYLPGKTKAVCDSGSLSVSDGKLLDVDANLAEKRFVCYAFPVKPGRSGKRVFAVNETGKILALPNEQSKWGGDAIPPSGLALEGGRELSNPGAHYVAEGSPGGSDEEWAAPQKVD